MSKTRYGLKLWSIDTEMLEEAVNLVETDVFQYIELKMILGSKVEPFAKKDIPFVLHAPTDDDGFGIYKTKKEDIIDKCMDWAKKLNAKHIIFHPKENFEEITKHLSTIAKINAEIQPELILIENLPMISLKNKRMPYCSSFEIQALLQKSSLGFCFDFSHAIKTYAALMDRHGIEIKYKTYLGLYMDLGPAMFHICDGDVQNIYDEHKHFGDGNFDLKYIKDCIEESKSKMATIEITRKNGLEDDVKNLEYFKNL